MPSLEWIGKEKVVNHHLEVPYHVLERQYSYDEDGQKVEDNGSENMIIHGDNLLALKSLLPKYEGRISCIYIDPPYNTGNEGWVYNDNVNDPRIKKWLGEVVGKKGDDLSRNDKWLCMMYPRLKLLQRLLADDGAIFISIDDNEQANLKLICDEVFGEKNFIATFVWQKRTSPDMRKKVSTAHEYIISYVGNAEYTNKIFQLLSLSDGDRNKFSNPDNDPRGPWVSSDFTAQGYRPNQMYTITTPGGKSYTPADGRCWKNVESEYLRQLKEGRMWFGQDGNSVPRRKTYLSERKGKNVWTWWENKEVGHTQEATQELTRIFGSKTIFDYPKPIRMIERIIQISTADDSIILDSFAGSGTTAHAVLDMNAKDGGNRHFILVEMEDYADSITAERVKRVIHGYPTNKKDILYDTAITTRNIKDGGDLFTEAKEIAETAKASYDNVEGPNMVDGHLQVIGIEKAKEHQKGTGGNFSFYELGEPLFHGELLNEEVTIDTIREYIYFMETRQSLPEEKADEPYYLGSYVGTAYYFYYEKDEATTLNREFLHTVKTKADHYVIYADRCTLSDAELAKFQITFKKIPRDIARL